VLPLSCAWTKRTGGNISSNKIRRRWIEIAGPPASPPARSEPFERYPTDAAPR
jgi:hypothetical protein